MVRIAEARAIITQRGEPRVLLRFAERPSETILDALRKASGKYRKVANSRHAAWYFEIDGFNKLRRRLEALGLDELSSGLKRACRPLNRAQMAPKVDPCGKKQRIETVNRERRRS